MLRDQRAMLAASCKGFDNGDEWEASRLATVAFNLLHDGGAIRSILSQLGLRASLRMASSGRQDPDPRIIHSTPSLIGIRFTHPAPPAFYPILGPGEAKQVQVETWWKKELIFLNRQTKESLTRSRLVYALRHQDGGSHIGELTDRAYVLLKDGAGWFVDMGNNTPAQPMLHAVTAMMRQVAWEITESLKQLGEVA